LSWPAREKALSSSLIGPVLANELYAMMIAARQALVNGNRNCWDGTAHL
jgi:hypothetical protein